MGRVVGIDLGTTYSAVAVLGDDGLPEILKNADGEPTTPSVVLFQSFDGKDEPLVGTMAKHSAASDPDNVVQSLNGRWEIRIGDSTLTRAFPTLQKRFPPLSSKNYCKMPSRHLEKKYAEP